MSIIALFVVGLVLVSLFCAAGVVVMGAGSPSYYAGLLYDRKGIVQPDPRVGGLTMCQVESMIVVETPISRYRVGTFRAVTMETEAPASPVTTLTDTPAVVMPDSFETVTVMYPIEIGQPRNVKGQFMGRYRD